MSTLAKTAGTLNEVWRRGRGAGEPDIPLPPLFFFTDGTRLPDPRIAIGALPAGCGVVVRHYELEMEERRHFAREIADLCQKAGRVCLVAGDAALAVEVRADGLHLPEHQVRGHQGHDRRGLGMVTAACHSAEALALAEATGVDAAFLSPVFATKSHAGGRALGLDRAAALMGQTRVPIYLLGGITNENAEALVGSGAFGLAAIGGLIA